MFPVRIIDNYSVLVEHHFHHQASASVRKHRSGDMSIDIHASEPFLIKAREHGNDIKTAIAFSAHIPHRYVTSIKIATRRNSLEPIQQNLYNRMGRLKVTVYNRSNDDIWVKPGDVIACLHISLAK